VAERVEHAVRDPGELRSDVVRDREHFLHGLSVGGGSDLASRRRRSTLRTSRRLATPAETPGTIPDVRPRFLLAALALAVPLDAARTVAAQDDEIAREAAAAKADLERRQAQLEQERRQQRQTVDRLAATRARIESSLARRRRLLSSIHTEIVRIRARERARER